MIFNIIQVLVYWNEVLKQPHFIIVDTEHFSCLVYNCVNEHYVSKGR